MLSRVQTSVLRVLASPESAASRIDHCVISTFQVAESIGFNGDFRAWEHLLRIHE
jgi:hypothetical protein